jgi:hypothetical protein
MNRKSLIINCLSKKDGVIYAPFFVEILNFLSAVKIVGNYKITHHEITKLRIKEAPQYFEHILSKTPNL